MRCLLAVLVLAAAPWADAAELNLQFGAAEAALADLSGVNTGPGPAGSDPLNADLGAAYQERGFRLIRNHDFYGPLDMATLYPDRSQDPASAGSFNFSGAVSARFESSDAVFASIVDAGFEPYFRIGDSYSNVDPPSTGERANWVAAAVNVLRHYREGQWNGFNTSFRYAEIWNEPDNSRFWPSPNTRVEFFQLYAATARALRSAFPALKIGGPGFTPNTCLGVADSWVTQFLDYIVAESAGAGGPVPLDFISWHVYSNDPQDIDTCAQFYRNALDSRGLSAVEQHVTEYNTDERQAPAGREVDVRTAGLGAAIMSAHWMRMQRGGVSQAMVFRGPDPEQTFPQFYGMFYAHGEPKKVALAALLWKPLLSGQRLALVGGSEGALTVLAAEDADGLRRILVANPDAQAHSWSASFSDGSALADYRLQLEQVDDAAATVSLSRLRASEISIPAESVQLLTLLGAPVFCDGFEDASCTDQ